MCVCVCVCDNTVTVLLHFSFKHNYITDFLAEYSGLVQWTQSVSHAVVYIVDVIVLLYRDAFFIAVLGEIENIPSLAIR